MKLIFQYFYRAVQCFPRLFIISMLLSISLTVMDIFLPWGLRKYLDQLAEENSYMVLIIGVGLFAVYLFIKIFVNIRWYVSLDRFGGKYIASLSLSLQEKMAETYYSEIEKVRPEIIRNVLFTDVLNVFRVIGHQIPCMLGAFTVIIACLLVSLVYSVQLTGFIFLAAIIGFLLSWCSRKILAKSAGHTNAKLKIYDGWCTQIVEMLPLIQSHNILHYYQEHTKENLDEFIETAIVEDKKTLFWSGITNSYHSLFTICLSALLAIPVSGNSIIDLVFFTMVADLVMQQTQMMETMFQQIIKLYVSFSHVDELRSLSCKGGNVIAEKIETVEFKKVSFSYPSKVNVLKNISCYLKRGDVIHLTGINGSGKSSFIKMIVGLYPPTQGEIFLNGRAIEEYLRTSLNRQILYINQDEKCLNETFQKYLEIITSRKLEDEQYRDLLHQVALEDERIIERNGDSLSVGQRKKLFILKFIICQEEASVIILDELTAGLDVQTTRWMNNFIKTIAEERNKIILLIDHNLEDKTYFTKELLFENGKILETNYR